MTTWAHLAPGHYRYQTVCFDCRRKVTVTCPLGHCAWKLASAVRIPARNKLREWAALRIAVVERQHHIAPKTPRAARALRHPVATHEEVLRRGFGRRAGAFP